MFSPLIQVSEQFLQSLRAANYSSQTKKPVFSVLLFTDILFCCLECTQTQRDKTLRHWRHAY